MSEMSCTYQGDGRTSLVHLGSRAEIRTDLPPDNGGQGRGFSPTDLFASSLAACALTIMGKMAESRKCSIAGTTVEIEKVMAADPRRVAKIVLRFAFPESVGAADREKYMKALHVCPVHNSLHPDIEIDVSSN